MQNVDTMIMKAVRLSVMWQFVYLTSIALSWAEERQSVSDLQRILAQNKLVVAVLKEDYPPLFATNESGRLFGSNISLVEHLAQELGVQVAFLRRAISFNGIIDLVSQGKADIGLATTLTLSRAKKVMFSRPYMTLNISLLLNRVQLIEAGIYGELRDIHQLRPTTKAIGLLEGSAYIEYARKAFPDAQIKEYATLPELYAAAENGELLAAVRNDLTAQLYLQRNPAAMVRLRLFVDQSAKDYLAFSVRPDSPHLLYWINAYLLLHHIDLDSSDVIDQYRGAIQPK